MIIKGVQSGYGISEAFRMNGPNAANAAKPAAPAVTAELKQSQEAPGKFLGELVNKVNDLQQQADKEVHKLATGEAKGLHEVMLAVEKSGIAFQFLTQVRNKAVEAYQEVMRMQV